MGVILEKVPKLIARDGPWCGECGFEILDFSEPEIRKPRSLEAVSIDHIVPKSENGGNNIENLRLTHVLCNQVRHSHNPILVSRKMQMIDRFIREERRWVLQKALPKYKNSVCKFKKSIKIGKYVAIMTILKPTEKESS